MLSKNEDQGTGAPSPSKARKARESTPRLSAQAWIDAGLTKLAQGNVDDIRVESLARDLGVTKGSFYWHFKNRNELLDGMLTSWKERATERVARRIAQITDDYAEQLEQLLTLPARTPPHKLAVETELAIRSWARFHPPAAKTVQEIDRIRAESFRHIFLGLGFSESETRHRTAIAQAFMLGEALLKAESDNQKKLDYALACTQLLLTP